LVEEPDRFQNPVGATFSRSLEGLYGFLVEGGDRAAYEGHVDAVMRIRAVQDFSASEALRFVFLLKRSVRDELGPVASASSWAPSLESFESRVDELALDAFEAYLRCRESIYRLRVDELKRQTSVILERAGRLGIVPGMEEET